MRLRRARFPRDPNRCVLLRPAPGRRLKIGQGFSRKMEYLMASASFSKPESTRHTEILSTFDEIAQIFLAASHAVDYAFLQSYLDQRIYICGSRVRRRAVLLAVHDMKEDVEAPFALRSRTHAALKCLNMRPSLAHTLYREIATALLRMEIVMRTNALHAIEYGEPGRSAAALRPISAVSHQIAARD
jgi:hypothetical protein